MIRFTCASSIHPLRHEVESRTPHGPRPIASPRGLTEYAALRATVTLSHNERLIFTSTSSSWLSVSVARSRSGSTRGSHSVRSRYSFSGLSIPSCDRKVHMEMLRITCKARKGKGQRESPRAKPRMKQWYPRCRFRFFLFDVSLALCVSSPRGIPSRMPSFRVREEDRVDYLSKICEQSARRGAFTIA